MWNLIHDCGWGAWLTLFWTAAGIAATLTIGRKRGTPAGIATAFAVAVLASAALGFATGQHAVEQAILHATQMELTTRVEILSIGTREASGNLLLGGGCAMILSGLGAVLALLPPKNGLRPVPSAKTQTVS